MKNLTRHPLFWIIIAALLPLWALCMPGLPLTHDGPDHVARVANFYQSLREGNPVPRWAGNLNWGYGHPILMFLYPFPSYSASMFHGAGFSLLNSIKIVFGLAYVASGLTMFLWLSSAFGKKAAVLGSLLYLFAPYRFVDMYVRGAFGEHVAFVFPPLICYFMYLSARSRKVRQMAVAYVGLSVSVAALILSHNAIAIMFIPVIATYGVFEWFQSKKRTVTGIMLIASALTGFAISAFFWIPAFIEGKYTLRNIVTAGEALDRFVPWQRFLYSPWNYGGGADLSKFIGIFQWIGIGASVWVVATTKDRGLRMVLSGAICILFGSLFIMTQNSEPVWKAVQLLQNFQFPWRFLSVSVFSAAVLGGMSLGKLSEVVHKKMRIPKLVSIGTMSVLILISTVNMWHPKGYITKPESYFSGIYLSTTDTGESSPIWSVRFMEHTPANPASVIAGSAVITPKGRTSTRHEYTIATDGESRILENTLYFPGWNIYVDGIKTDVQFQDPDYRGLMTYNLSGGNHHVAVLFENTLLRKIAGVISFASVGILTIVLCGAFIWKKKT